jgi:hypothetical protein
MQGCRVRFLTGKDAIVADTSTTSTMLPFCTSQNLAKDQTLATLPEVALNVYIRSLGLRKFSLKMTVFIQYGTIFTS